VIPASTGAEALRLARQYKGPIHLLVTDVIMPGMNGRQLADELQKEYPGVRVLFMSGYTEDVIAHQGILDPGLAFIQKPFSPLKFLEKVRETLGEES
jgi:YesN/AraC family two-component response regulator